MKLYPPELRGGERRKNEKGRERMPAMCEDVCRAFRPVLRGSPLSFLSSLSEGPVRFLSRNKPAPAYREGVFRGIRLVPSQKPAVIAEGFKSTLT